MKCAVKLLLVEDNRRLQHTLRRSLVEAGYAVDVADDAEDGQALAEVTAYDVVVLDVMLPRGDGLQVCRELRRQGVPTPILMLTARDAVEDRVRGLDCGADDYLVKPFALGGGRPRSGHRALGGRGPRWRYRGAQPPHRRCVIRNRPPASPVSLSTRSRFASIGRVMRPPAQRESARWARRRDIVRSRTPTPSSTWSS
jgi:CheY-like chemotaxis protein